MKIINKQNTKLSVELLSAMLQCSTAAFSVKDWVQVKSQERRKYINLNALYFQNKSSYSASFCQQFLSDRTSRINTFIKVFFFKKKLDLDFVTILVSLLPFWQFVARLFFFAVGCEVLCLSFLLRDKSQSDQNFHFINALVTFKLVFSLNKMLNRHKWNLCSIHV